MRERYAYEPLVLMFDGFSDPYSLLRSEWKVEESDTHTRSRCLGAAGFVMCFARQSRAGRLLPLTIFTCVPWLHAKRSLLCYCRRCGLVLCFRESTRSVWCCPLLAEEITIPSRSTIRHSLAHSKKATAQASFAQHRTAPHTAQHSQFSSPPTRSAPSPRLHYRMLAC